MNKKSRPINLPMKEGELHQSVAELLDWILVPPAIFTTFPAGWGRLSTGTAGRLKASGLKRGMPDILVFGYSWIRNQSPLTKVIGIELKAGRGDLTNAQREMHAKLKAVGVDVFVVRSINQVIMALSEAGIKYHNVHIPMGKTDVEPISRSVGAIGGFGHVLGAR